MPKPLKYNYNIDKIKEVYNDKEKGKRKFRLTARILGYPENGMIEWIHRWHPPYTSFGRETHWTKREIEDAKKYGEQLKKDVEINESFCKKFFIPGTGFLTIGVAYLCEYFLDIPVEQFYLLSCFFWVLAIYDKQINKR